MNDPETLQRRITNQRKELKALNKAYSTLWDSFTKTYQERVRLSRENDLMRTSHGGWAGE